MSIVLITGMSGVGKSTVLAELAVRGVRVADTDAAGLVVDVTDANGHVIDHVWDEPALTELLDSVGSQHLFLAGCVSNQGRFYDRFTAVVLISVPREVLLERIAARTSNDYGKKAAQAAAILADLQLVEPLLRAAATEELDGTLPVPVLADRVEQLV